MFRMPKMAVANQEPARGYTLRIDPVTVTKYYYILKAVFRVVNCPALQMIDL